MIDLCCCVRQLSGTGEYHVHRSCEDFEWLHQHLFSQENVPGIQGVIVSTFISSALILKGQLGIK